MGLAGIIAEYDPFHSGHAWQIHQAKQQGAQAVAVCMSQDLTQRGGAALLPPHVRVRAALAAGADLVIGLPNPCAVQSAEGFAAAGVAALSALPQLEWLVFGAESPNTDEIWNTAQTLRSAVFGEEVRRWLGTGMSFAAARAAAAKEVYPPAEKILASPNNNLGVEYCKAIAALGSHLKPFPIQRTGAAHGQQTPGENGFASASFLRSLWTEDGAQSAAEYVPKEALELYRQAEKEGLAQDRRAFDIAVLSRLRAMTVEQIARTRGTSEGLEHRLAKEVRSAGSLQQLYDGMKTKRYAHARIRRYALCAALGYTEDLSQTPPYLHILGANQKGLALLKGAKLPADTSLAALENRGGELTRMAQAHAAGADLAALCRANPGRMGESYTQKPIIL